MEFGTYITVDGTVMCFATEEEAWEYTHNVEEES